MANKVIFSDFVLVIFFCVYAYYEGTREALYYHIKNKSGLMQKLNEHPMFSAQRFCVISIIFFAYTLLGIGYWLSGAKAFLFTALFPFIHDGSYYMHRNRLDDEVYPKGWLDMSTTSTAFSTRFFTPLSRFVLFWVSLTLIVLSNLFL